MRSPTSREAPSRPRAKRSVRPAPAAETPKLRVAELYAGTCRSIEPYRLRPDRFEIALLADTSAAARTTYLANFPDAPYFDVDLRADSAAELRELAQGEIDILLGCPPCQGFSEGGLRAPKDERNDHIVNFAETVRALRPRAFALENVARAAVSPQFVQLRGLLEASGYELTAAVLNAAQYGSAQARQRLVVVGCLKAASSADMPVALPAPTHATIGTYFDYTRSELREIGALDEALLGTMSSTYRARSVLSSRFYGAADADPDAFELVPSGSNGTSARAPRGLEPTPTVAKVLAGLPKTGTKRAGELAHVQFGHSSRMLERMGPVPQGGQRDAGRKYHGAAYARLHGEGLAKTLTRYFSNAGSGRFWHPTSNRSLTVREAARLQGFPDDFAFAGGATQMNAWMVGNALDAALANVSFRAVTRSLGIMTDQ